LRGGEQVVLERNAGTDGAGGGLCGTAKVVPFPVVVDRPVSGVVGKETAGAEARLYCVELYAALKAPLFHGSARIREIPQRLKPVPS
jgi:hypothetical protein